MVSTLAAKVDKTWRDLLEKISQNPACLSIARDTNLPTVLQNSIQVSPRVYVFTSHMSVSSHLRELMHPLQFLGNETLVLEVVIVAVITTVLTQRNGADGGAGPDFGMYLRSPSQAYVRLCRLCMLYIRLQKHLSASLIVSSFGSSSIFAIS